MNEPNPPSPPPPPPPQRPASTPPPGWYHDGNVMRWWDGEVWGPAAPDAGPSSDDRTFSILSHAGALVGGFVVPLVFYVVSDDETRPQTRWHAREALNFQITFMLVYLVSFVVFFVGLALAGVFGTTESNAAAGVGFAVTMGLFFIFVFGAVIVNYVFSIIAAVRASQGIRWKYPVNIRFVKP